MTALGRVFGGGSPSVHGRVQGWSRGQWACRLLMVLGVVGALCATIPAGATPAVWLVVLTVGLALAWAWLPEAGVGAAALLLVLAWWGIGLRDGLGWWSLLAAAGLVLAQVAAILAAYGPAELPLPLPAVRRWAGRGLGLFGLSVLVLVALLAVADTPEQPGVWLVGAAAAAGLVLGLLLVHTRFARE